MFKEPEPRYFMKRIILYVATDSLWVYVGLWMYVSRFKKNVYVWSLTEPQQEPWFCNVYLYASVTNISYSYSAEQHFLPHSSASTFQFLLIFQQLTKKPQNQVYIIYRTSPRRHLRNLSNHTERAVILCLS